MFDIFDEKGIGFVRFMDIELWWKIKYGLNGFSEGVIENLCKVILKNGFFSFERLCMGMKLVLKM